MKRPRPYRRSTRSRKRVKPSVSSKRVRFSGMKRRRSVKTAFKKRYGKKARYMKRDSDAPHDAGASAAFEISKFKFGRAKPVLYNYTKLLKRDPVTAIARFGATERYTSQGAFGVFLRNNGDGTTALPMYALELTQLPFLSTAVGNQPVSNAYPFHRFTMNNTTGIISPSVIGGRSWNGTSTNNYYEYLSENSKYPVGTYDLNWVPENAVLLWSNLRFLLKCPSARPGYFKITIVQFTDRMLLPGTQSSDISDAYHGFYQKRVKSLIYNPIATEAGPLNRTGDPGFKVLKTIVRRWNPQETDNAAFAGTGAMTGGSRMKIDVFMNHNRYCNFKSFSTGAHKTFVKLDDDAYVQNDQVEVTDQAETYVFNHPANARARVYAFVEATTYDTSTGALDPVYHASFDMEIRNKWLFKNS